MQSFLLQIKVAKMYSMMTVMQLKEELRTRKASICGKKAALIERLVAYDRNANFGLEDDDRDEVYAAPATESFLDINASSYLPPLTKQHIQAFAERFQTQLKGCQMYESRFLVTARVSVDGNISYIQGKCKAQMKKITYVVNVKLNSDGSIEQSHCECAAGSGVEAHCKHVMVLLYGIENMVRTKTIIFHQVCTQRLMAFKRPRKVFFDSPLQAQKLPSKRKRSINYLPIKEEDIMDNYQDYVTNLAIAHGHTTMPILQTVKPANPFALEWDHQYTAKSLKDKTLEDLLLKNPPTEALKHVEIQTRGQHQCTEWHKHRAFRITASYFYTVTHSKSSTQENLAEKLLNPRQFISRATTHGKVQEPIAIQKYNQIYNLDVQPCGLFVSQTHPFLGTSPDGLLGSETVIEVKCPYVPRFLKNNSITVPYLEEKNGVYSLKESHPYYCLIQGQLFCTNRTYCNLIIFTFTDLKVVYVYRNEPFISKMISTLSNFYITHFEKALLNKVLYRNYNKLKP